MLLSWWLEMQAMLSVTATYPLPTAPLRIYARGQPAAEHMTFIVGLHMAAVGTAHGSPATGLQAAV